MPAVGQILETSLYVDDVERSETFYRDLFGFRTLLSMDRMCAMSVHDRQVLLLFHKGGTVEGDQVPGGFVPPHDGDGQLHLAFAIAAADLDAWRQKLAEMGVAVISQVNPPQGGSAIYFRDPDGHLIELAEPRIWGFH